MKKGSITIFAALSLMLIASFIFAMLESARYYGLQSYARLKAPLITESVFAEYHAKIWEDYHLLFLDGAYGGSEFSVEKVAGTANQIADKNLNYDLITGIFGANDLFQMSLDGVSVDSYQLATDQEGTVFLAQVASYMRSHIGEEVMEQVYERIQKGKEYETDGENTDVSIESANDALANATAEEGVEPDSEESEPSDTDDTAITIESDMTDTESSSAETDIVHLETEDLSTEEEEENMLDFVIDLKRNAVLGLVIEDVDTVSENALSSEELLLERECLSGNDTSEIEIDWSDKTLLELYLKDYFSNYTKPLDERALEYELEYIICGKEEDKGNLDGVVARLMLVREAANLVTLVSDRTKVNEADAMATLLVGFTGNPAIIKAVQIGIIAAWAYLESILDIKTLLQGGKIALLKTSAQWTTDVKNIVSSFKSSAKAKECEDGLYYDEFLLQFLFFTGTKEQTYRAMDLIEANVGMDETYGNIKMDHMISKAVFSFQFNADSLFWNLISIGRGGTISYQTEEEQSFSYIIN